MRSISCIAAVLFAAPLVTAAAQQPFEGVVEYDMTGNGQPMHTIYYQKGSHVRTEMNVGGQTAAMIMDGAAGTMTTLVPAQKMYMTMNFRAMAASMQRQSRDSVHLPKITATGRHETIAGHDCEHVLMTNEAGDLTLERLDLAGPAGAEPPGTSGPTSPTPTIPATPSSAASLPAASSR